MQIKRVRPTVFEVTLHTYELSALIATARWVVEGAEGDFPDEARDQLKEVISSYDAQLSQNDTR